MLMADLEVGGMMKWINPVLVRFTLDDALGACADGSSATGQGGNCNSGFSPSKHCHGGGSPDSHKIRCEAGSAANFPPGHYRKSPQSLRDDA